MNTKDIDNKIPIYQLDSKEKVLKYYINWTKKGEYNKNMVEWNYQAPQNAAKLFNKYAPNKDINILDAGCGSGLVGVELQKYGYTKITGVDFSNEMLNLITNNPEKVEYLKKNKITVSKMIKIKPGINPHNKRYLETKKIIGKHLLNL